MKIPYLAQVMSGIALLAAPSYAQDQPSRTELATVPIFNQAATIPNYDIKSRISSITPLQNFNLTNYRPSKSPSHLTVEMTTFDTEGFANRTDAAKHLARGLLPNLTTYLAKDLSDTKTGDFIFGKSVRLAAHGRSSLTTTLRHASIPYVELKLAAPLEGKLQPELQFKTTYGTAVLGARQMRMENGEQMYQFIIGYQSFVTKQKTKK